MNRTVSIGFIFILVFALLGTACSQQNKSQNEGKNVVNPTSNKSVTLSILTSTILDKPEGGVEQSFADEFMKQNPGVKIEFIGAPASDVYKKIIAQATGNQLPDIFMNTSEFMPQAYDMGIAEDLSQLFDKSYIEGFYKSTIDFSTLEGKLQFLPWYSIPMGLVYRADWFEQEGLKQPETWDDFLAAAKKLTKDTDGDGKIDRWGFAMNGVKNGTGSGRFINILRSFGAQELRKDDNGKWVTDIDSTKGIEAFRFFSELYTKYGVVPPAPINVGYPEAVTLMSTEKTAMMITGPHTIGAVLAQNPNLKGKLAGAPLPMKEQQVGSLGLSGYSISKKSPNKELAVKYLKFINEKSNMLKWNEITGRIPARKESGEDPQLKNSPLMSGFVKIMNFAYQPPNAPFYSKVGDAIGNAYQAIMTGQMTPEQAAKSAAENVREEIKKN